MEGSVARNSVLRRFRICAMLIGVVLTPSLAMAQLRTGRGTRTLYQESIEELSYPKSSDAEVAFASFQDEVEEMVQPIVPGPGDATVVDPHYDQATEYLDPSYGEVSSCDSCGDLACDSCNAGYGIAPTAYGVCPPGCGPLLSLWYRMSVRAEVPMYWRRDQGPPALVTTSPAGTAATVAGELGQATTDIVLGQGTLQDDPTAGVRLTFSTWLGPQKCWGVMVRYWDAGDQDLNFNFNSNTHPILARPFFNTTTTGSESQDTQLISFPGESDGSLAVSTSNSVGGIDLILRREIYADRFNRMQWLWGYQNVQLDEGLSLMSNTTVTGAGPLQGTSIAVSDVFRTENEFHGMSYGIMNTRRVASLKIETMFRLGAGNLQRRVNISGSTTTTSGGVSNTENQGLLARNTNSQPFVDDTFIVIPELAVNLAYRIRPGLDFNLGYNYMVIPKVAQAAQQLDDDLAVNLSDPLTGALDPALDFDERKFWLHSLGFGLQLRY